MIASSIEYKPSLKSTISSSSTSAKITQTSGEQKMNSELKAFFANVAVNLFFGVILIFINLWYSFLFYFNSITKKVYTTYNIFA
jgi:hypothetical protein